MSLDVAIGSAIHIPDIDLSEEELLYISVGLASSTFIMALMAGLTYLWYRPRDTEGVSQFNTEYTPLVDSRSSPSEGFSNYSNTNAT